MKITITVLSILIFSSAKSQTAKDNFIKEVYSNVIDTSLQNIKLSKAAEPFPFKLMSIFGSNGELHKVLPDSTIKSLEYNSKLDTAEFFWNNISSKIVLVNQSQIDTLTGRVLLIRNSEDSKKKTRKREKELNSKQGLVYFISNLIFDKSEKFVLFHVQYVCGRGCGSGCFYLFELKNGKWKELSRMSCTIS